MPRQRFTRCYHFEDDPTVSHSPSAASPGSAAKKRKKQKKVESASSPCTPVTPNTCNVTVSAEVGVAMENSAVARALITAAVNNVAVDADTPTIATDDAFAADDSTRAEPPKVVAVSDAVIAVDRGTITEPPTKTGTKYFNGSYEKEC